MKLFRLIQQQQLPGSIETAWDFFSTTENLDKITPPDMEFKILTGAGQRAFEGQIITYRIKPIFNIPMYWVTEMTHLRELEYFVDEQRIGPYRFWHHLHRFTPKDNGVFMEDILDYALPYGMFGQFLGQRFIHQRIKDIFTYRQQILDQIFNPTYSTIDRQPVPKT